MSAVVRRARTRTAMMILLVAVILASAAQAASFSLAPAFTLELFTGQTLRLADLKGTAVILLFWTQW